MTNALVSPVQVALVSDSRALGYSNNAKFVIGHDGTAYFAVRTRATRTFNIVLFRSSGPWDKTRTFDRISMPDTPSLSVSAAPQRSASIALGNDGAVHIAWYGGTNGQKPHQIHYARVATQGPLQIMEELEPWTISGFALAYPSNATGDELWQEHPSVAVTPDGQVHIAWEARDVGHLRGVGQPSPGIAYATRQVDGRWSITGPQHSPPYLSTDGFAPSQSRPVLVVTPDRTIHVLCYGSVHGKQKVLYGQICDGQFSGWSSIAPSGADQRHVVATADAMGRIHIAWREGAILAGSASGPVRVLYAVRATDGTWGAPIQASNDDQNGSTPSIRVDQGTVYIAWTAWKPGTQNSDGQVDNAFPTDSSNVQGAIMVATMQPDNGKFEVRQIDPGPASYPTWAQSAPNVSPGNALLWTRGTEKDCLPKQDCVRLMLAAIAN